VEGLPGLGCQAEWQRRGRQSVLKEHSADEMNTFKDTAIKVFKDAKVVQRHGRAKPGFDLG